MNLRVLCVSSEHSERAVDHYGMGVFSLAKKKKRAPLPQLLQGVTLIDTHCHLDMEDYASDSAEVLSRAVAAGIEHVLTIGIDLPSSQAAIALAENNARVFCAIGVHPHNVAGLTDRGYDTIAQLAAHPRVKGYGEIGLDYVKKHASKEAQITHFKLQVALAKQLELPLIVHDREAHADVLAILTAAAPFPAGGVMHCYSGDKYLARDIVELGFCLSIPGVVTFNKAEMLQEAVRSIPLTSLLLETDGPYLAPEPYRGKRNEPAYLLYTAQKVAALKELSLEEVARQTTLNAKKLFSLEPCG